MFTQFKNINAVKKILFPGFNYGIFFITYRGLDGYYNLIKL